MPPIATVTRLTRVRTRRLCDRGVTRKRPFDLFQQVNPLGGLVLKTGMGKLIVGSNPTPSALTEHGKGPAGLR
ncbi:hypothetical protein KRMM14A1004_61260 [Krasilnikovia sp. MM14-A1004]